MYVEEVSSARPLRVDSEGWKHLGQSWVIVWVEFTC